MSKNLAPIVLFVYNRPWHTQQTIEALQKNKLAKQSKLFIYSDAPKNTQAEGSVAQVRSYIKNIDGFKKITIIERDNNWGLANSIVDGVTSIINKYGKIIVLEDDLVTSPYFLKFMNEALEFYKNETKVWHISGWNYPIKPEGLNDVFLWRVMNCWGWATWADKWVYYEKDIASISNNFSKDDIQAFNIEGAENFFGQIEANKLGKKNTWAIFWYASIFKNHGLCLNPTQTYVENIGLDGGGINCGNTNIFSDKYSKTIVNNFPLDIEENIASLEKIKAFYKMNKTTRVEQIKNVLRNLYRREQFNPSIFGIFINPFYFSRKGLSQSILELIVHLKGSILDIGCGTKPYEKHSICDKYIGLELDNQDSKLNKQADFYYDGKILPFDDCSMDSVLTSQVFEHVSTPDKFLQEVNRVLKNDGRLLLSVPFVWDEHEQPYDFTRYTSFGIQNILLKNGFEVMQLKKTASDFSSIVQLLTAYIYKSFFVKNPYINLLITFTIIAPIHIIGLVISIILPKNNDFYLDNVVLARKIKSENQSV